MPLLDNKQAITALASTVGGTIVILLLIFAIDRPTLEIKCTLSMTSELSNQHSCVFCVNASNDHLKNMYIINRYSVLGNFTLYESFDIAKALYFCTQGYHCTKEKLKIDSSKNCLYSTQISCVKFCFDFKKNLVSSTLFGNITLNVYESEKLFHYLNSFLQLKNGKNISRNLL